LGLKETWFFTLHFGFLKSFRDVLGMGVANRDFGYHGHPKSFFFFFFLNVQRLDQTRSDPLATVASN